jgi:PAS domain-containing protein
LSRSLLDFARLVSIFDQHGVAFVAVTQLFNTRDSMGRLTLNILLSFAQFERELIAERTRDKIAMARRRGRWSGGTPPLGYDLIAGRLAVNPKEAKCVRAIFELYLQAESLAETVEQLNRRHWHTKRWTTKKGQQRGGRPFRKNTLHHLLTNIVYLGKDLCELLPQTVFEMDLNGRLTFVNRMALETFGYTEEEFQAGVYNLDMLVPQDRERGRQNMGRVIQGEHLVPCESGRPQNKIRTTASSVIRPHSFSPQTPNDACFQLSTIPCLADTQRG